jgi:hypothetical protein
MLEGLEDGSLEGLLEGLLDGMLDGLREGLLVGKVDDFLDGTEVGGYVFSLQSPTGVHASVQQGDNIHKSCH